MRVRVYRPSRIRRGSIAKSARCTRTTPTYALLRRRVKNSVFWQTPKKKAAPKMQATRERTRGECTRVFSRARSKSHNKIVLSKAMNIDRDAAHPHIRVHPHIRYTLHVHVRSTQGTYTYMNIYTDTRSFRPESKRHIKEKSTSLSRCALTLKLKVDQKR